MSEVGLVDFGTISSAEVNYQSIQSVKADVQTELPNVYERPVLIEFGTGPDFSGRVRVSRNSLFGYRQLRSQTSAKSA